MNSENRSLEQIYRSAVSGLYARLRSNYDYLYARFGDEGIKMIEEMSREFGLSIVDRARNSLGNNDIDSVAGYLLRIFNTVYYGMDSIDFDRQSDTRIVVKALKCPLNFDKPGMCLAHTTMEQTVVEGLNPGLRYRIGKSIPAGDAYCEHIIEVKKEGE
ncbi:hypothetical protein ACFLTB_07335 [Chloroflexota bacterium]